MMHASSGILLLQALISTISGNRGVDLLFFCRMASRKARTMPALSSTAMSLLERCKRKGFKGELSW